MMNEVTLIKLLFIEHDSEQKMAASWEVKEHLCCAICLDTLDNTVTLQCGHNVCMACGNIYCDQEDCGVVCSCPLCRQILIPRPVLKKNTVLVDCPGKTSSAVQSTPPGGG